MSFLQVERDRGIVTLTIRREERRNALHGPLWTALGDEARRLSEGEPPRVVILTGAGGHFSAGMDLKIDNPLFERLFPAVGAQDTATFRALILELKAVVDTIASVPCPVIAAIDGACAGGGLEVALACDLRVASAGAFFSMPEARVGMMPDVGGSIRLMRLIGRARALELCLTGTRLDASTAWTYGLVNRVAEEGGALALARTMAEEISTAAPSAARELVRLMRMPQPSFEEETEAGIRVLSSGEVVEGATSFMERRAPTWAL